MAERFTDGQPVVLVANEAEGWPEQRATVVGDDGDEVNGTLLVRVAPEGSDDDGLREVATDDVRPV